VADHFEVIYHKHLLMLDKAALAEPPVWIYPQSGSSGVSGLTGGSHQLSPIIPALTEHVKQICVMAVQKQIVSD
jgi:hypothetical protein